MSFYPKRSRGVKRERAASRGRQQVVKKMIEMAPQPGRWRPVGYYKRFTGMVPELKFLDTALSFNFDSTAEIPATGQLNLIPQGDTQSTRDGYKCIVRSIQVKGSANFAPGASASASDVAFLYVILDTQCNGQAATVADANTGIFTAAALSQANVTIANGNRFKILKKWVLPFQASAGVTTAYNTVTKYVDWYKKCNIPLYFDNSVSTGAITSIRSNNIFLVAGTAGYSDDLITFAGTARLRFADH